MDIEYRGKRDRWTPEIIEQVKALWAEGKSAGKIADLLPGGFTRNAIIGKARRLGLDGRASPIIRTPGPAQPLTAAQRMRKTRAARKSAGALSAQKKTEAVNIALTPPPPVWNIEPARRVVGPEPTDLVTLEQAQLRNGCRWPSGHRPSMMFCGKDRSAHDVSYCPEHHARAWKGAA